MYMLIFFCFNIASVYNGCLSRLAEYFFRSHQHPEEIALTRPFLSSKETKIQCSNGPVDFRRSATSTKGEICLLPPHPPIFQHNFDCDLFILQKIVQMFMVAKFCICVFLSFYFQRLLFLCL